MRELLRRREEGLRFFSKEFVRTMPLPVLLRALEEGLRVRPSRRPTERFLSLSWDFSFCSRNSAGFGIESAAVRPELNEGWTRT
jgi:hypothetical protein